LVGVLGFPVPVREDIMIESSFSEGIGGMDVFRGVGVGDMGDMEVAGFRGDLGVFDGA